ncbi:MAG TPA: hypothetical protein VFT43_15545 [Candidatus Polarisedimenticolia bacterium]|nr:hypothetical protein [Candidatus Polarisedimenticolia bacterium]
MTAPTTRPPAGTPSPARLAGLPNRLPPLLYFSAAHLFLAAAFATLALDPVEFTGFFQHARMVAVVHMVTLGWITLSILGALYMVGPMALRMPLPARAIDYVAFVLALVGVLGIVGHFFIAEYVGVAWSAGTLVTGVAIVAVRVARALWPAPIQRPVKIHIAFAFLNLLAAAAMGLLLALDKRLRFLHGSPLPNLYAHAHLAALGWAGMMVMGTGYRLLPMVLPAEMPKGRSLYASAVLLETGTIGIFVTLLTGSGLLPCFALLAAGGFTAFFLHVLWMRRRPRQAPAGMPRPDFGVGHALQALVYAGLAAALGLTLSVLPTSEASLRAAGLYGLFGLVGFLAQMVLGIQARLVPMLASYHSNLNLVYDRPAPKAHELPVRRLQRAIFSCWTAGVPLLAIGLWWESAGSIAAGGGLLFLAVVLGALNGAIVMRHAYRGELPTNLRNTK